MVAFRLSYLRDFRVLVGCRVLILEFWLKGFGGWQVGQMVIFTRVNKHRPSPFIPLVLESMRQLQEGASPITSPGGPAPDDTATPLAAPVPPPASSFPGLNVS